MIEGTGVSVVISPSQATTWLVTLVLPCSPSGTSHAFERLCMARAGIIFGLILCGLTFAGLVGTPAKTPTQFYPMMLGIPILFCGVVALNPHRRRLSMLVASTIAVTGAVIGAFWSGFVLVELSRGGTEIDRFSLRLIAVMTLVCIVFALLMMAGFAKMKRKSSSRQEQAAAATVRLPSSVDEITQDSDVPTSHEIA